MYAHVVSLGVTGLDGYPVTVETHISGGLPKFAMVGLPDSAVKESSERVRSAIKNLNCPWPASHVTVNLAPADVRKTGPVYDLPLLLAVLTASGQLEDVPEDAAFLRRVMPQLQRVRAARTPPTPAPCILSEDCALAAAVFALCGRRLGESRYIQAAQRAVGYLAALSPALPPSYSPVSALNAQLTCGAGAALALALLTLGQAEELHTYRESGLRLLGAALHAFTTPDGLPMHTPQDAAAVKSEAKRS